MKEITRAATAADLADLLRSATSATAAWERDGEVEARPVAFRCESGAYHVGAAPGVLRDGVEIAVVVDAGPWYFDLRGVRVRGRLVRLAEATSAAIEWFEVRPEREVAWHYGMLRPR